MDPFQPSRLDYSPPLPRIRSKWVDVLLLWLAGLAGVILLLVPVALTLFLPESVGRWAMRSYYVLLTAALIFGWRLIRRFGGRRI